MQVHGLESTYQRRKSVRASMIDFLEALMETLTEKIVITLTVVNFLDEMPRVTTKFRLS